MEFTVKNQVVVISKLSNQVLDLSKELLENKQFWSDYHVILEVQECPLSQQSIYDAIAPIFRDHNAQQKSFVLVDKVDRLKKYPEELSAAPTQDEAFDLIEMEEIARDLGF